MSKTEILSQRIREKLAHLPNVEEKKMFGGLCYMVDDKMCVGITSKEEFMCRINPEMHEETIQKNGCRTMDMHKRPMKGFVFVEEQGIAKEVDFDYWMQTALEYNKIAKSSKKKKK